MKYATLFATIALLGTTTGRGSELATLELNRLRGTWKVVTVDVNGRRMADANLKNMRFEFAGDQATRKQDGLTDGKLRVVLDPTQSPKTIDLIENGTKGLAIYELAGDTLKLVIDCRPVPLFRILDRNGYAYSEAPGTDSAYVITISRKPAAPASR